LTLPLPPPAPRAAAHHQVSVRKAALIALSRLSELLPLEPGLCAAWVRSALPLVRDPESGIQDAVLEWAQFLLLDRAAAVGGAPGRGGRGRAAGAAAMAVDGEDEPVTPAPGSQDDEDDAPPAAVAAAELRPMLAAFSSVGRAAGACIGKVCAALAAKRKLAGKKVAKGVEAFVSGVSSGSAEALGAWMLLKEVAAQEPAAPSWQFLQQRWAALQAAAAAAAHGEEGEEVRGPGALGGVRARPLWRAEQPFRTELLPRRRLTLRPPPRLCAPWLCSRTPAPTWRSRRRARSCCSSSPPPPRVSRQRRARRSRRSCCRCGRRRGRWLRCLHPELRPHSSVGAPLAAAAHHPLAPSPFHRQATLAFNLPPAAAAAHIVALHKLTSSGGAGGAAAPEAWCRQAYAAAHELLHRFVSGSLAGGADPAARARLQRRAAAAVFAVGELALLRVSKPPAGLTVLLQALTAPKLLPGMATAADADDPDAGAPAPAEADEDADGTGADGAAPREVPASLQGHAWISLGKVCLVDEPLAKKLVPLFIQVRAASGVSGALAARMGHVEGSAGLPGPPAACGGSHQPLPRAAGAWPVAIARGAQQHHGRAQRHGHHVHGPRRRAHAAAGGVHPRPPRARAAAGARGRGAACGASRVSPPGLRAHGGPLPASPLHRPPNPTTRPHPPTAPRRSRCWPTC
jgi:hypothetical protein